MKPLSACPTDQTLAAFADGLLADADRAGALQHLDGCPSCFDRVAALAVLADVPVTPAPDGLIEAAMRRPPPWAGRVARYGAVAAGVVLAVAVSLWSTRGIDRPIQPAPSPSTSEKVRTSPAATTALVVETPRDNERLPAGFEVRWQGPPSVVFYEVQLTTGEGDLLWSSHVEGTTSRVNVPTVLSNTQPSYLWVTAQLPEGRRLASNVIRVHGR